MIVYIGGNILSDLNSKTLFLGVVPCIEHRSLYGSEKEVQNGVKDTIVSIGLSNFA